MFGIQEWVLQFRLGYLDRYWTLASAASLCLGFLLSVLVSVLPTHQTDSADLPHTVALPTAAIRPQNWPTSSELRQM
jgi:hypothetical protein